MPTCRKLPAEHRPLVFASLFFKNHPAEKPEDPASKPSAEDKSIPGLVTEQTIILASNDSLAITTLPRDFNSDTARKKTPAILKSKRGRWGSGRF
jgi:hypothetical protein